MPTRSTPHRCRRRLAAWRHRLPLKGGVIGTRHSKRHTSFPPLHHHSRSPPPVIPASPPTVIPASFQRESSIFVPSATHSKQNHSPLEGESARQGRSPPASRWGDVVPRIGVIDSDRGGSSADILVPHPSSLIHLLPSPPISRGQAPGRLPRRGKKRMTLSPARERVKESGATANGNAVRGTWFRSKCASAGRTCEAARRDRQDARVRRVRGQTTTSGFRPRRSGRKT